MRWRMEGVRTSRCAKKAARCISRSGMTVPEFRNRTSKRYSSRSIASKVHAIAILAAADWVFQSRATLRRPTEARCACAISRAAGSRRRLAFRAARPELHFSMWQLQTPSKSFDDDDLRARCFLADVHGRLVLHRVVPLASPRGTFKFADDHSLRRPISFEDV